MGAFENIGLAESKAEYATAKATGQQISLTHRATAAVTLYANVIEQELGSDVKPGRLIETGMLTLRIPVQTGFAVMTTQSRPITEGDRIEYPLNSARYFFVAMEDGISQESNGYVYVVKAFEKKSLTTGVQS